MPSCVKIISIKVRNGGEYYAKATLFIMTILPIFFVFLLSGCGKQNQASNVSGQATETSASTLEPYLVGEKLLQFLPDEKLKRLPDVLPRAFRAIISVDGLTEEILLVDTQELDYAVNLLAKINVEECVSVPSRKQQPFIYPYLAGWNKQLYSS